MEFSKNIRMTPHPSYTIDLTAIGYWIISTVTLLIAFFGFTNKYFRDRVAAREAFAKAEKEGKQEFIEKIVNTTVTATLNSVLGAMREDISTLFKYREEDKKDMNNRFDRVMTKLDK